MRECRAASNFRKAPECHQQFEWLQIPLEVAANPTHILVGGFETASAEHPVKQPTSRGVLARASQIHVELGGGNEPFVGHPHSQGSSTS